MKNFSEMSGSELEYWAACAEGFDASWDGNPESSVLIKEQTNEFYYLIRQYNPYANNKQFLSLLQHGNWTIKRVFNNPLGEYITKATYKHCKDNVKATAYSRNMQEACMRALCIAEYGEKFFSA